MSSVDLYEICSNRYKNQFKLAKFIEDITGTEINEYNFDELYDKCKNYLFELYPVFNKISIIDNMLDDEEINAMLLGFNELYNDIKLEPLDEVKMNIKI